MFKGILSPVVTILDENGNLDLPGNEMVINRLISQGINGLLFMGSIGEFFALSTAEKQEFISFAVKTVAKKGPCAYWYRGTVQAEVIALTRFAEQAGADGVVVISPYYFKLDPETIYRYYASLAQTTTLPIMLYNYPDRTAVDLGPELVLRLAREFKHIVAIKDTVDNISHTRRLIQAVKAERPDFCVLSGFDEYLIPNLMAGGDGILGGLTNVIPHVFFSLMTAYEAKDLTGVAAAQAKISVLMNLYDVSQPFVAAIKGAVVQMGLPVIPKVKEPAADVTSQQMQRIQQLLIQAEVL